MRQTQRAHSKLFTVRSVSFFCFSQIQTNLVKTYQLVFVQQHPVSDTEMGENSGHLALFFTHYFTLFSSIMEFHPYFTHKKMDQIRSE